MIALPTHLTAAQFDAPYYDLQEKNKDKWAAEDKQINAKSDKPFFIYWATYTQQLQGSKAHHNDKHVDKTNARLPRWRPTTRTSSKCLTPWRAKASQRTLWSCG